MDHYIGLKEKRLFFRKKLAKFAEYCDHNIDPCASGVVYLHSGIISSRRDMGREIKSRLGSSLQMRERKHQYTLK
jgi:hypothetical protein